jgi:hypothetical protein
VFLPLDGKTNMPEALFASAIILCATLKVMFIKMRKKKIILFQLYNMYQPLLILMV